VNQKLDWRLILLWNFDTALKKFVLFECLQYVCDLWQHFVFFLTWLVSYLIPDVPAYIKLLMQREMHLAKKARYNEAFSTLHEERRKSRTFADLASDAAAMRRASLDASASPDDAVAWDWNDAIMKDWNLAMACFAHFLMLWTFPITIFVC